MSNTIVSGGLIPSIQQPTLTPAATDRKEAGFGDVLRSAIDQVEGLQQEANRQVGDLLQGGRSDVHNVMIAFEKADVAFQLMMQVRNKIVNAYQEIEKMQF